MTNLRTFDEPVKLRSDGIAYGTVTVNFDYATIIGQGKPTLVNRGITKGFSLPVYSADNEELFSCKSTPLDWDNTANPTVYVGCYLDTANTGKKFKLQVSWTCTDLMNNAVVSAGSTDVETETDTGTAAQYTGFKVGFVMDLVAGGCNNGYKLACRIRRLAASSVEIAGEVVVCGMAVKYPVNKLGATS